MADLRGASLEHRSMAALCSLDSGWVKATVVATLPPIRPLEPLQPKPRGLVGLRDGDRVGRLRYMNLRPVIGVSTVLDNAGS